MKNLTPELAEIFGLLCAEGSHILQYCSFFGKDRGKVRYYKNQKSERIEFYNKDIVLLNHLKKLLYTVFKYEAKITKGNKINIANRKVINSIINHTKFGFLKWRVPNFIKNGNKNIKISFIRGYFDGDGTISNRIRFFSSNKEGLLEVANLLKDLGIRYTIQGPINKIKRKPAYIIQISEKARETFLNMVKPISKRPGYYAEVVISFLMVL